MVQNIELFLQSLIIKISKKHEFVGPICETTDKFLNCYKKLSKNKSKRYNYNL